MKIEKNNLDIPEHLNENFFLNALENGLHKNNIRLEKILFEMGSALGENYCSCIYRVKIQYSEKSSSKSENISLIIKSMPITQANEFLNGLNVYLKEKVMFNEVLPKIEILLHCSKLSAKCFYAIKEPIQTIVFEDLCTLGYRVGNRQQGLDEAHCRLILTKLAKFHAGSMVLARKYPNLMDHFTTGFFNPDFIDHLAFKNFFSDNLDYLANEVSNWKGYEFISDKLKLIYQNLKERCLNVVKSRNGEIKVLNHGDLWVNNFLFKYDNENQTHPIDALFVDFQMSYFGSPGIDLNYFFNTSVQLDILRNKRDQLLRIYHQVLEMTLNDLRYDGNIPTFDDIKMEFKEKEFYGFITGVALFPVMSMDKEQSKDNSIESFTNQEFVEMKRKLMFSSKRCQDHFKYTLKRFNELGVLD